VRRLLLLTLAACGGSPPPPQTPTELPPVAKSTCSDASVLLRVERTDDDVGRREQEVIAQDCETAKWSPSLLDCIAGSAHPSNCLAQLSPEQHALFDREVGAWRSMHGVEEQAPSAGPTVAPDCATGVGDVAQYAPPLDETGADLVFATAVRREAVVDQCETMGWVDDVRMCLAGGGSSMPACLAQLPADEARALEGRLGQVDALLRHTFAMRGGGAAAYDCAHVVTIHYGDGPWAKRVPLVTGEARTKLIANSRAAMTKACGGWSDAVRACVVATDDDLCFAGAIDWPFPAIGLFAPTGISECDDYERAVITASACPKLPDDARRQLLATYGQSTRAWQAATSSDLGDVRDACKQGAAALKSGLAHLCR
jgi:hypothetical protein